MAKKVQALVKPRILNWARESAGLSIEEVAQKLRVSPSKIKNWEEDQNKSPYIGQLRKLAKIYNRPLSEFYLPAPPVDKPFPHDFRRNPGEVAGLYSPDLRKQLRFARERQKLSEILSEYTGESIKSFSYKFSHPLDPEYSGEEVRRILNIDYNDQKRWGDAYKTLKMWRSKIEDIGVLVFQFERVSPQEAWGFSIKQKIFPVIGLNIELAPNGRTFTLLHEFAHLLLEEGGICDIDDYSNRGGEELKVEVFCNHVAAAALMPKKFFMQHELVKSKYKDPSLEWSDEDIKLIANNFGVSKEAAVRRLLTFKRVTVDFYRKKRSQYQYELKRSKEIERERYKKEKDFKRDYTQRAISNLGDNFVQLVLNSYGNKKITLADAAKYLDVHPPRVKKVERRILGGA